MEGLPLGWLELIDSYDRYLISIGRPKTTRYLRRHQIAHLARSLNLTPSEISEAVLIEWFGLHDWKPETRRSYRSGLRGFFAWTAEHGHTVTDPAAKLRQVKQGKAVPRPAPDHVWAAALVAADLRVTLMLRLAAEAGLRRAEIAQVHVRDLRHGPGGAQLHVHGKGNRDRLVPITDGLAELIGMGAAGHTPRASSNSWLFPSIRGGHLGPASVGALCSAAMPEVWTLHTLRHRAASRAYRGTRNLRAVQQLLGHSNVAVTERYTAVDDDEVRAAMMAAVA